MDYGIRTAVRHMGLAGLLAALLPVLFGADVIWFWIRSNWIFCAAWLIVSIALGILADEAVRWEWFARGLAFSRRNTGDEDSPRSPSLFERLFLKWASCSRCVGYWWGGIFSFAATALYLPAWFPGSLYFMLLGASLTTGVAVSAHLVRSARDTE
jgi:hypothetical protein